MKKNSNNLCAHANGNVFTSQQKYFMRKDLKS